MLRFLVLLKIKEKYATGFEQMLVLFVTYRRIQEIQNLMIHGTTYDLSEKKALFLAGLKELQLFNGLTAGKAKFFYTI
ncbi:hypothetical protein BpHYR1_043940 [Brachionus plicatilis]|uniref:Uncharacterized protein n=1 Tax=Brachionus plicatilis TaxID=10195 RepID=A0A3M7RJU5_BRAPC|nr:hypothetical protein BpHYR1_043940 [Brachionus plicatilis]